MKIGLGQLDMVWENKEASLEKVENMVAQASEEGAEIIIFPEMSLTGFSMNLEKIGEYRENSWTLKNISGLAKRYSIAVGVGWAAKEENDKGTNRFTIFDENGNLIVDYGKLHPFSYGGEASVYKGGDELKTFEFHGRTIAPFVCYDLRFPEIFQEVSYKADIIIVISNWPKVRREHWITLLKARAIENQAYVVGVNCTGTRDELEYCGDSVAYDAMGIEIAKADEREQVLICELDDRAWHLRGKFKVRDDRRTDIYRQFIR